MKRREVISLLGGIALPWPRVVAAQRVRLPIIGFLGASTPAAWGSLVAAFERRLRELGWIEGRTVTIEYRWAEGRGERYADIAAEFVRLKVDVIVTSGGAVLAAKQVTSTIPIVFAMAVDPLGGGLVASLAQPGANVTGVSSQSTDLAGKRLELLREIVPGLRRLASSRISGIPPPRRRWEMLRGWPGPSASRSSERKSGKPMSSRSPSTRSATEWMLFISS